MKKNDMEEFNAVKEEAVEDICIKADKWREDQSITNDTDIIYLMDDMSGYYRQVEAIQEARTVKQLEKALSIVFGKKEVKRYMRNLK